MSFRDDGKVYLEVAANGAAGKDLNPNVPYGVAETAHDLVACIQHGATALCYHPRYDDGRPAWTDVELSRTVLETAARDVDALAYPDAAGHLEHLWALAERPPAGTELLLAPFDPPRDLARVRWNEDKNQFDIVDGIAGDEAEGDGPNGAPESHPAELDRMRELGLVPSISVRNTADLRWVVLAARVGILRQPLLIKLFFSDQRVSYNEPDPAVLDFLVSRIPPWIDHEIAVVPYQMNSADNCQELWEHALDRGLGIRVGLGDGAAVFRTPDNAELVNRAVRLMAKRELSPATPEDMRIRFAPPEVDETNLVRVVVNRNRCMGWGVCFTHGPEIYQPDADGFCVVKKPYVDERLLEQAIEGAAACPERAIRIELCDDVPVPAHARSVVQG